MTQHSHCVFCDDIRFEVGNKTSMMGIYGSILYLPEFPITLPKLCIAAYRSAPVDEQFKSFSVRISIDEKVLVEHSVPEEFAPKAFEDIKQQAGSGDSIQKLTLGLNAILSPLVVEKESVITVVTIADGNEMVAGKLRVRKGRAPQSA